MQPRQRASLARRLSHAQGMIEHWQAKIAAAPANTSAQQLGVWRAQQTRWQKQEAALIRRLEEER